MFPSENIRHLSLISEVVDKRRKQVVLCPRFLEKEIPQILDLHFQTELTSEHVVRFGWVPFN